MSTCDLRPLILLLSAPELHQQSQDFDIKPDQRHHQTECCIPFHMLRQSDPCAGFDKIEIEHKIERSHDYHENAEPDPEEPVAIDIGTLTPKKPSTIEIR